MQTIIDNLLSPDIDTRALLFDMPAVPLSNVPFHDNTPSITRFFAGDFPLHMAVHEVSPVRFPPPEYTRLHVHEDFDEINVILSPKRLRYRIRLGEDEYTVENNRCIWIPRGTPHAANVLEGNGYFITLRLNAEQYF